MLFRRALDVCYKPLNFIRVSLRFGFPLLLTNSRSISIWSQCPIPKITFVRNPPQQPLLKYYYSTDKTSTSKASEESVKDQRMKKIKGIQCPGCGAAFHSDKQGTPGYLVPEKLKQVHQANAAPAAGLLGSQLPPLSSFIGDKFKAVNNEESSNESPKKKTTLSESEIQAIAESIEDPEIRELFITSNDKFESPKNEQDNNELLSNERPKPVICQRCFNLRHHNKLSETTTTSSTIGGWKTYVISDPTALKFLHHEANAMIIVVCDLFDIPGSLIPNLNQFIGDSETTGPRRQRRIVLVANKVDLLPSDIHLERISQQWLKPIVNNVLGLELTKIHFVSAKKNLGVRELAETVSNLRRPDEDIYLVGRANVGKSELINSLLRISLRKRTDREHKVMTSNVPGTTMGLYGIPLEKFTKSLIPKDTKLITGSGGGKRFVYDTPGIFSSKSILNFLTFDEIKHVVPNKRIIPLTFALRPGKSICFGGLGRLDFVMPKEVLDKDGDENLLKGAVKMPWLLVTAFSRVPVHVTKIEKADEMFERILKGQSTVLKPPYDTEDANGQRLTRYPPMKIGLEFEYVGVHKTMATTDVVFGGIGWFALTGILPKDFPVKIRAYSPFGTGIYQRKPMLPFEYKGKITKYTSNTRKTLN